MCNFVKKKISSVNLHNRTLRFMSCFYKSQNMNFEQGKLQFHMNPVFGGMPLQWDNRIAAFAFLLL